MVVNKYNIVNFECVLEQHDDTFEVKMRREWSTKLFKFDPNIDINEVYVYLVTLIMNG